MPTFVDTPQVAIAARRPGVQGRDRQPDPARSGRRDRATSSARRSSSCSDAASFVTGQVLGDRRRPDRDPVATEERRRCRRRRSMLERVTPNVFTTTKLRGCNPSFVVTSDGVVVIDTPQLPDARRRDARGGRVARADPLPHQHREPRRPHLRQLLVPGRRRGRQPPGAVRHLHGSRTRRSTRSPTPSRRSRPTIPTGGRSSPDRDDYYADLPRGHGRLHRRPDAAGRRPHVPLPVDARAHARPARGPRAGGAGRLHRRHDLQRRARRG